MLTTHNDGRVFVKTHSWYLAIMSGYAANRLCRRDIPVEQGLVSSRGHKFCIILSADDFDYFLVLQRVTETYHDNDRTSYPCA